MIRLKMCRIFWQIILGFSEILRFSDKATKINPRNFLQQMKFLANLFKILQHYFSLSFACAVGKRLNYFGLETNPKINGISCKRTQNVYNQAITILLNLIPVHPFFFSSIRK